MAMRRIDVAPARLTVSIAAAVELPVASIGSRRITSRSAMSPGELHEVLDGSERSSSRKSPMKPTRTGNQREHGVEHPDTRAQDRADRDLLARDASRRGHLERRLDLDLLVCEVLGRLVSQQKREPSFTSWRNICVVV